MKTLLLASVFSIALGSAFSAPVWAEDVDMTASEMLEKAMKAQAETSVSEEAVVVPNLAEDDDMSAAMQKRKAMLDAKAEAEAVKQAELEEAMEEAAKVEVSETVETNVEIEETETGVIVTETTTETTEIEIPEDAEAAMSDEPLEEDIVENTGEEAVEEVIEEAEVVEVVVAVEPASDTEWGYTGANGAAYWGALDDAYALCSDGQEQSPINIASYLEEAVSPMEPSYQASALNVSNEGHGLSVNFDAGSSLKVGGVEYQLSHLKFHTPSEHYLDGAPYPMEAQFVHQTANGGLGIVSVMMKLGAHNRVVEGIWQNAPIQAGMSKSVDGVEISAADLMPQSLDYYKYQGSLTTPPCSEGVQWHVLKDPIELSETQLKAFQALFPVNARPVQPLGERVVTAN